MAEETTDNEFYVVVWEDKEYGVMNHIFLHLKGEENIFQYMSRVHNVSVDEIDQIYKRTYVKK